MLLANHHGVARLSLIFIIVFALISSLFSRPFLQPTLAFVGKVTATNSLTGSSSGDQIGSDGAVELPNGNLVIISPHWNGDRGAVTCLTPAQYKAGNVVVSAANSLVGSSAGDLIGGGNTVQSLYGGVTPLSNGNYVVFSPGWTGGIGAATWGNKDCSTIGAVSNTNSLVGSVVGDYVGGGSYHKGVTALTNGNYVVSSPDWNGGFGAATWGDGTTGIVGVVSATNSLVGDMQNEFVGMGFVTSGIIALINGNYVIGSPNWYYHFGAVTWGNGATGISGTISNANSLVGTVNNEYVGETVTTLSNGNYVATSFGWNVGTGAVTWGNGATGTSGDVSALNSLTGSTPSNLSGYGGDEVGSSGITELTNGNYVVASINWNKQSGAATWCDGTMPTVGIVSAANSLIGNIGDYVADHGITALSNGNYVVPSDLWSASWGAVTWGNGATGTTGFVSAANSLIGSHSSDKVGYDVIPLTNGNYVVASQFWNVATGAATWADGTKATTGVVSATNSLVGTAQFDHLADSVTALSNGNYVVTSPNWNGARGAVTWGNGTIGVIGPASSTNSLVGNLAGDLVGYNGTLQATLGLNNGNYVVASYQWNGNRGAVTWGNGTTGTTGIVSHANSLVGSALNDSVGDVVIALSNGNYATFSAAWNGSRGAASWGNGLGGTRGYVSAVNSLVDTNDVNLAGGSLTALVDGNFVIVSPRWNGNIGAVTYGTPPTMLQAPDTIGMYANGTFYLRNTNTTGPANLIVAYQPYKSGTVYPVTGDWNGDGIDTVGSYVSAIGAFYLRDSNTPGIPNHTFTFGSPGDRPLSGYWDATMTGDGVGVYRPSNGILYLKRSLTTGFADYFMILGRPGDYGIAGDWDGNGYDSVGVYRGSNDTFYLSNTIGQGVIYGNAQFVFGAPSMTPFAGDWTGSGVSRVGMFANGRVYLRNSFTTGTADTTFIYGSAGALPLAGHWNAPSGSLPSIIVAPTPTTPAIPGNGGSSFDG